MHNSIRDSIVAIRNLREGFVTNFFYDQCAFNEWVENQQDVTVSALGKSLFIVRQNEGFWNLYFASTSNDQLRIDLMDFLFQKNKYRPMVVDLVARNRDLEMAVSPFTANYFVQYSSLVRMSRPIIEADSLTVVELSVAYARPEDAMEIDRLLHHYFDPLCEQLPFMSQIKRWIDNRRVLLRLVDSQIAGFLVFEINGTTSYLRYWFTHPDYRNKGVGSALLRQFFAESVNTKRQLFWVIEENENAVKRYRHYGFVEEDMFDKVFILKQNDDEKADY